MFLNPIACAPASTTLVLAKYLEEQLWDAEDASASGIVRAVHRVLKA
jgi:hypothetical protein